MTWSAERLASALTAVSLLGVVVGTVVTVAAMAARYISGSDGVQILGVASGAYALATVGIRALEKRAACERLRGKIVRPAS